MTTASDRARACPGCHAAEWAQRHVSLPEPTDAIEALRVVACSAIEERDAALAEVERLKGEVDGLKHDLHGELCGRTCRCGYEAEMARRTLPPDPERAG